MSDSAIGGYRLRVLIPAWTAIAAVSAYAAASDPTSGQAAPNAKTIAAIDQALGNPVSGQESGGADDRIGNLPKVLVTTTRMDPYTIELRQPAASIWLRGYYAAPWHPAGAIGAEGVVGIAGAHVGDQILSIEGKAVSAYKGSDAVRAIFNLPQPVHLIVKSSSGRIHAVECFNE